jgi:hypothetical protein
VKVMSLRRSGSCADCARPLEVGDRAGWNASTRTVHCPSCLQQDQHAPSDPLTAPPATRGPLPPASTPTGPVQGAAAGASAQREFERRVQRREQDVRQRHPKLGRLLLALNNDPSSTRVWAQGAAGERAVAAKLDELAGDHLVALHDRRMVRADGRRSRANIDHLVVAATGVWVVDAKTHKGALEVRRSGGLFTARVERLYIGGRDKSVLIDGLRGQVEAVAAVLAQVDATVPVRGALCFVGTELPWFGESIGGVPLVGRRGLAKLLKQPGDLGAEERSAIVVYLASHFVPA